MERPRKPIGDGDDDRAHVDRGEGVAKLIRFLYTSQGHEFMKGKLLKNDQGIAHTVFGAGGGEAPEGGAAAEEGGDEAEGDGENKAAK